MAYETARYLEVKQAITDSITGLATAIANGISALTLLVNPKLNGTSWTDGYVTASDETTYNPALIAGILVITEGNVVLDDASGNTITMSTVAANTFLPVAPTKVMAATTSHVAIIYK